MPPRTLTVNFSCVVGDISKDESFDSIIHSSTITDDHDKWDGPLHVISIYIYIYIFFFMLIVKTFSKATVVKLHLRKMLIIDSINLKTYQLYFYTI